MSFFDSDVVRAEMTEISELQEDIYRNVFKFSSMNKEEKMFHVSMLERLLDKQKVLYTRLSLSDDPEAKQMKERIIESAVMMGLPKGTDMSVIFNNMSKMLEVMKNQIDKTGSDL
jgi:GTPase Era involved in 16S rRNA processing